MTRVIWSLMPIVLVALLLVAMAGILLTVWLRPRRRSIVPSAGGELGCGRCGYSTRGLITLTCPECGGDFRTVGIGQAPQRVPALAGFVICALFLTILLSVVGITKGRGLNLLLPARAVYEDRVELTSATSGSRAYTVRALLETWGPPPPARPVTIETNLPGGAGQMQLTFDALTNGYEYVDPTGARVSNQGFDGEAVLAWMAAAGVDTQRSEARAEANRLAGQARRLSRIPPAPYGGREQKGTRSGGSGIFQTVATQSRAYMQPSAAASLLLNGFWFFIEVFLLSVLWRSIVSQRVGNDESIAGRARLGDSL